MMLQSVWLKLDKRSIPIQRGLNNRNTRDFFLVASKLLV
jgi:hypothetical protein